MPALAQCAVDSPLTAPEAENDPVYIVACNLGLPGGGVLPCPKPNPPTVVSGWTRSQGMVISAAPPTNIPLNAVAVWWRAEVLNPEPGTAVAVLWKQRSTEDIPTGGLPPGTAIQYGAPGLMEGKNHRFRVAFEYANGGTSCWSLPSDQVSTDSFPSDGPPPPAGVYTRVRDDFDRPTTSPVAQGGDGLGPAAVWIPSDGLYSASSCRIADNQSSAYQPPTSGFTYQRVMERSSFSYAEMEVRVDRTMGPEDPGFKYNLQAQARIGNPDPATGAAPSYAAKLIYGPRQCTSPAILLFRLPEGYNDARCVTIDGVLQPDPLIHGVICDGTTDHEIPWLDQADETNPDISKPVWVRIVLDSTITGYPIITGEVLWKISGESTWHHCITDEWIDMSDNRLTTFGKWGGSFHDRHYFVNTFRAGDGPQ